MRRHSAPPARFLATAEDGGAGERGRLAQLLLDPEEAVVLRDAVRARRRAGLDLSRAGAHGQVGDRRVLGLARAVGDHGRVAGVARDLHRLQRLGESADLVHLDQDRVPDAEVDPAAEPLRVGDEQVVAYQLGAVGLSFSVRAFQPSQSSSSMPSSIETIGKRSTSSCQ